MGGRSICEAAKRGDLDAVKNYLKKERVNANLCKNVATIGIRKDNVDLLKCIVEKDISILSNFHLLHRAIEYGALNAVRYLVETDSPKTPKPPNYEPIGAYVAVEKGNLNILKYFVEDRNIDINTRIESRRSLLFQAVCLKRQNIIEYLIEERGANLTTLDDDGQNILYPAAYNHDLKFIKYVLDEKKANLNINQENKAGKTLLLKVACWWNCLEILEYLVEQKHVNVSVADERSRGSPLHCVRSAKVCAYLLEHGANINERDLDGDTPLHSTISKMIEKEEGEYEQIFDLLIKNGADVDSQNNYGQTPLILASSTRLNCTYRICKCLIERGADLNTKGHFLGRTPLHGVVHSRSYTREPNFSPIELVKYFIEHGARVNPADNRGNTPLHFAVESRNILVCEYLIEHGADISPSDDQGNTPLHIAVQKGDVLICEYLVEHGADINLKNNQGDTPYSIATQNRYEYGRSIRQLFMNKGALKKRQTKYTKTTPSTLSSSVHVDEKSFHCPECGAKFVKVRRSVGVSPSGFSPSSNSHRELKISHDVSRKVSYPTDNLPASFDISIYYSIFRAFLTLVLLLIPNSNMSSIRSFSGDTHTCWSPKTFFENRMDPVAEDIISSPPTLLSGRSPRIRQLEQYNART